MLLIATDEAGYGPKLGPLVIVATAWHVPDEHVDEALVEDFAALRHPVALDGDTIKVDDSKAVFQPGKGLDVLHAVVSASLAWCHADVGVYSKLLGEICSEDLSDIEQTPWLEPDPKLPMRTATEVAPILQQWESAPCKLLGVRARVITADRFNRICANGSNKADLLSRTTLDLARKTWEQHTNRSQVEGTNNLESTLIFCDRHGGRRYYAAVLQHTFPSAWIQIESESAKQSIYRFDVDAQKLIAHFTVKGDSFTPVALASMHAKYLRERFMESFNRYFHKLSDGTVKPTAGYPVDADRFLADIDGLLKKHGIDRQSIVRCR